MKIDIERLEIAMADSCMTYGELAKKAEVSSFTISRMQTGTDVKPATLGKIAKALGVNAKELIEDTAATVNQANVGSESN